MSKEVIDYVSRVRAYLATDRGRRDMRELMVGRGYPYERAVAEVAVAIMQDCRNGRLREIRYELLDAIVDEVIVAELAVVA